MELDDLAAVFQGVRFTGSGFQARCPAHDDRDPSLTVSRGATSWLVKCHAGCHFLDVAQAAGLPPLAFKFGGVSSSSSGVSSVDARRKLRDMILETRHIPYRLAEIAQIALRLTEDKMVDIRAWYPTWVDVPLKDALRMHIVMMDTVMWDMIDGDWSEWGSDWLEAKREIARLLWETYRNERSNLVQ